MRTRRVAKWVGTGLSVLTLAVGIVSMWREVEVSDRLVIACGVANVIGAAAADDNPIFYLQVIRPIRDRMIEALSLPSIHFRNGSLVAAIVPLWLPLIIVAIPTALLWRADRRCNPPNHCRRCGYDLTGNVSGRCPECGERA